MRPPHHEPKRYGNPGAFRRRDCRVAALLAMTRCAAVFLAGTVTGWAVVFLAGAGAVRAQNAPIQTQPLPPLQQQWQRQGLAPVQQAPPPSYSAGPGSTGQALTAPGPPPSFPGQAQAPQGTSQGALQATSQGALQGALQGTPQFVPPGAPPSAQSGPPNPAPPTIAAGWPNVWVPAGMAKLQALDKVNAQASDLTIKVGQSATFGSLTITVKSCVVRPPDQPADAAAYLDVTDSHTDSPGFDGWILRDEPSVSMMQHPIYDLRVTGCA
jgi:hypothetical protein